MLYDELMAIEDFGSFTRIFREDVVGDLLSLRVGAA